MSNAHRELGVAISGGGHRVALWGLGSLLYLVDSGLNRSVSVISSVSGGSITNGVVAERMDFRSPATDRRPSAPKMQPLILDLAGVCSCAPVNSVPVALVGLAVSVMPPRRKEPARV